MKNLICLTAFLFLLALHSQAQDSLQVFNSAQKMLNGSSGLNMGGYGEVHSNTPLVKDQYSNTNLDVHRMVMLIGYQFNSKASFVSEIEFEHVKEVYVEQAFMQYKLKPSFYVRAGLLLIPMGVVNEYHEPTAFWGVERPLADQIITPSTWREIGAGVGGNFLALKTRYQLYVINGLNGYDGAAKFNGSKGLRSGRQKGAESFMSTPNVSGRAEFYGLKGTKIGASIFAGQSESSLMDGLDKTDNQAIKQADSSRIGIRMLGLDAAYQLKGFLFKGQGYFVKLNNAASYNSFSGSDLGSAMTAYYLEASYNVLRTSALKSMLYPFFRYSYINTHHQTEGNTATNPAYEKQIYTFGLNWKLDKGLIVKADAQFIKPGSQVNFSKTLNVGFGVMF